MTSTPRFSVKPAFAALAVTLAALGAAPSVTLAGPSPCLSTLTIGGISATRCTISSGNDDGGFTGYVTLGKAEAPKFAEGEPEVWSRISLPLSGAPGLTSFSVGDLSVNETTASFNLLFQPDPVTLDFGVVLKAGSGFTFFEFDGLTLAGSPVAGLASQLDIAKNGNLNAISHITFYASESDNPVPAPGPLGLLGLGLAALALSRRSKG